MAPELPFHWAQSARPQASRQEPNGRGARPTKTAWRPNQAIFWRGRRPERAKLEASGPPGTNLGNSAARKREQRSFETWHEYLGGGHIADAVIDRLINRSYKLDLKGDSLRKEKSSTAKRRKPKAKVAEDA